MSSKPRRTPLPPQKLLKRGAQGEARPALHLAYSVKGAGISRIWPWEGTTTGSHQAPPGVRGRMQILPLLIADCCNVLRL